MFIGDFGMKLTHHVIVKLGFHTYRQKLAVVIATFINHEMSMDMISVGMKRSNIAPLVSKIAGPKHRPAPLLCDVLCRFHIRVLWKAQNDMVGMPSLGVSGPTARPQWNRGFYGVLVKAALNSIEVQPC